MKTHERVDLPEFIMKITIHAWAVRDAQDNVHVELTQETWV
jgi:hypothetical protein